MSLIVDRESLLASWPSCYACDEKKSSREHVPPLCFFPEEKDQNGHSLYRNKLITVPSCDRHNSKKSGDDFYALFHLAGTNRGNHCAELVRKGAIARTIERDQAERRSALTNRLLRQIRGKVGENYYGELDPQRMVNFLKLCARGLYFYEKVKPLKLPLRVASLDFDLPDEEKAEALAAQRLSFNEEMKGLSYQGANPDVFRYAICEKPEKDVTLIEMIFFGELHRWAFYHPDADRQVFP